MTLTTRAEWSRTVMRAPAFHPSAFDWLRDQTFYRLGREIGHRYRPGGAPPCSRVDIRELAGGRELELLVRILDGSQARVRLEGARGVDVMFLRHVDFARICMLFWDGQAADFNERYRLAFDWRSDIELRNRLADARRGLEPRRTTAEGYRGFGVDLAAGPDITAAMTYTTMRMASNLFPELDPYRYEREADFIREEARRIDLQMMQIMMGQGQQRHEAEARGETLLREWLSPQQLAQYEGNRYFDVIGSSSKRRYRVTNKRSFNVLLLDADEGVEEEICVMPVGNLVMGDMMLAQKVALETNEPAAIEVANRRYVGRRLNPLRGLVGEWGALAPVLGT